MPDTQMTSRHSSPPRKYTVVCTYGMDDWRDDPIVEGLFETIEEAEKYVRLGAHTNRLIDEDILDAEPNSRLTDHEAFTWEYHHVVPLNIVPESGYIG